MTERSHAQRIAGIAFLIGALAGIFGGLVGLGGGVVMVPLLTAWAGMTQHEAHATSLAGVVATGIAGALTYAHQGEVDWSTALLLAAVSVLATYAAAHYSRRISGPRLRGYFGLFLIVAALLLVFKDELLALHAPQGVATIAFLLATGLLVGIAAGLLGVGGGALMVPMLVIGLGMAQHLAQGTSLAAMVPAGASGTAAHVRHRTVRFDAVLGLVPGIAAGSWIGGRFALALPASTLRVVFAVVLGLLGIHYQRGVHRAYQDQLPDSPSA
ncbi:MAG: sulfite exporter TauE/SafE family protein [Longimicrobiales bacterium]